MLTKEPSFASLLVKQSPAMHYGHGWIMGKDGKRWHPCLMKEDTSMFKKPGYSLNPCCLSKTLTPILNAWLTAVLIIFPLPVFTAFIRRVPRVISGSEGETECGRCFSTSSPLTVKTAFDKPLLCLVAEIKPLFSNHVRESRTKIDSGEGISPIKSSSTVRLSSRKSLGSRGRGVGKDS